MQAFGCELRFSSHALKHIKYENGAKSVVMHQSGAIKLVLFLE